MNDMTHPEADNMGIWNRVCTTDPEHTKQVQQRGGFTSIDAQWQIQRATEVFGPVGKGWGYEVQYRYIEIGTGLAVVAEVTIWHGTDNINGVEHHANHFGPIAGMNMVKDLGKDRIDDDAPKKALTDALTKGLSHLGFSADVFLGLYDDNKYIAKAKREFEAKKLDDSGAIPTTLQGMLESYDPAEHDPKSWFEMNKAEIAKLSQAHKNWLWQKAGQKAKEAA